MKRGLVFTVVLVMLCVLSPLFANGSTEAKTAEPAKASLRMSWWGNDARHKATIEVIDQYMAKNPNVEIAAEYRGKSEREKVATQLAGGTVADIVQLNPPWMGDFTAAGTDFFEDLRAYSDVLDLSGFSKQFLDENGVYNGILVGLPTGINARTSIINKTLANEFGIPTSIDTKWTWEDFYKIGKTVHEKDSSKYFFNADTVDMTEFVLLPYLVQRTGNQLINDDYTRGFTEKELVEVFEYIARLYKDGVVVPVQEGNVFLNSIWTNPNWLNGNIVLEFSWTSLYGAVTGDVKGEMGTFILPELADAKNSGLIITPSQLFSISKTSKNKAEAAKFLNYFFNDPEAAITLGSVRSIPPTAAAQEACEKAGLIDPEVVKATKYAQDNQGLSRNTLSGNSEIVKVLNNAIEKIAYDSTKVNEAAAESIKMIDYILSEMK